MSIRIIPVKIETDGTFSVFVQPTSGGTKMGFPSASINETPTKDAVLAHMPDGILTRGAEGNVRIAALPHNATGNTFVVVAGDSQNFASQVEGANGWRTQTSLVAGPLPVNAKANEQAQLYVEPRTGSMVADDTVALLTAVHAVRAMRTGNGITNESAVTMDLISRSPEQTARFLADNIDQGLRKLTVATTENTRQRDVWQKITKLVQRLSAAAITSLAQRETTATDGPDKTGARQRATRAAAGVKQSGTTQKPA